MLELKHVKKYYKGNKAVDDVSFQVNKGEVFGLIGENGAGKSTVISMISTLIEPDYGEILYDGNSIVTNPQSIQKNLGYVPQDIALYTNLTGYDNLRFFGKMYHISSRELEDRIKDIIGVVQLDENVLRQKVVTYSGGMSRKLNIAVALLHEPEIIILDEPTVGIDVQSRNQILNSIRILASMDRTVIYVGHYMDEIDKICDTICVMKKGRIVLQGPKEKLLKDYHYSSLEELYIETISNS